MARRVGYPLLLLGVLSAVVATLHFHWDPDRVSGLTLIGTIGYLSVLERVIPYRTDWWPSRRELRWYAVYFVLSMVGGALGQGLVTALVGVVAPARPGLPLGVQIPLALLVGTLGDHLVHRWSHHNRWLWRLHGVHHVPEKVNVANNGVNHFLDVFVAQAAVQLVLAMIGFSQESVFAVGIFLVAQGYFVHANIDVSLGLFGHVLAGPEQHRLHHSTDLAEAGHFSSDLSLWDHVFGSYTWRPGRVPAAVGLADPASFPATGELTATLLHPWRRMRTPGPSV
ncbi:sterol desaturase family protein [Streptomyces kaniharaensis]|uniref:Sterol desaturase family protein n=1 Tax=Streptomyces kaniharaensis TaxID=212423 RepID=A0A6N7KKJ7_9ACTN|nr:sterol desaturase family protein [Streptomyces kaniharaensis]